MLLRYFKKYLNFVCVTTATAVMYGPKQVRFFFLKVNSGTMNESFFTSAGNPRQSRRVAGVENSSEWAPNSPSVSDRILKGELAAIIRSVVI